MDRDAAKTIPDLDRSGLREFGLTTGVIVAVLFGLFFPWILDRPIPLWPWLIFAALGLVALVVPTVLQPVYRGWMRFGLLASKVTTPIIMGIVFFLLFTPVALFLKIARKDAMNRKFHNDDSYRIENTGIRKDSLEHPY